LPIPLFLREVGLYYWNRKQVLLEYETIPPKKSIEDGYLGTILNYFWNKKQVGLDDEMLPKKCIANEYTKTFRFFDIQKLFNYGCQTGYFYITKYLVKHGVDIRANYEEFLCRAYGRSAIKLLSEKGANAVERLATEHASWIGDFEAVKFLIENRTNVHSNNDGALRIASENGHSEIAKFLAENGANRQVL
jgi:hypothetical protein